MSAPTVNNVTDAIVSAPTVNDVADEAECTIVLDINDGAHDQLAIKAKADLAVTASYLSEYIFTLN